MMSELDEAIYEAFSNIAQYYHAGVPTEHGYVKQQAQSIKQAIKAAGYTRCPENCPFETRDVAKKLGYIRRDEVVAMIEGWLKSIEATDNLPLQKYRLRQRVQALISKVNPTQKER